MKSIGQVRLKLGKDKAVRMHHAWVFSGALDKIQGAEDGETVDVLGSTGNWLARGYYNSRSQITIRLWTTNRDQVIDRAFLRTRIERSIAARPPLNAPATTDCGRLVNAESDGLPGLVVDRYGEWLVVQFLTLGIEHWKTEIVEILAELTAARGIYERSDVDVREKEGLSPSTGVLAGAEPPDRVEVRENGFRFLVDVKRGHKTGFYLDQSENRRRVAAYLQAYGSTSGAEERQVLNAFSYTGGFAVYVAAALAQAHVLNLDASADALNLARENMRLNGVEAAGEFVEADAFQWLRRCRDARRTFNAIVLDPPKFVYAQANLEAGLRGYKDINLLALKLLRPGGILVSFSCSGLVDEDLFQKVLHGAAIDAGRDVQIVAKLFQAPDHPVLLSFPESAYLKGLVCRVA